MLALGEGPGLGKGMVGPSLIPCSEPASRVRWVPIRLYLDSRPLGLDKASTACRSFAAMRMVAKSVPRTTVQITQRDGSNSPVNANNRFNHGFTMRMNFATIHGGVLSLIWGFAQAVGVALFSFKNQPKGIQPALRNSYTAEPLHQRMIVGKPRRVFQKWGEPRVVKSFCPFLQADRSSLTRIRYCGLQRGPPPSRSTPRRRAENSGSLEWLAPSLAACRAQWTQLPLSDRNIERSPSAATKTQVKGNLVGHDLKWVPKS